MCSCLHFICGELARVLHLLFLEKKNLIDTIVHLLLSLLSLMNTLDLHVSQLRKLAVMMCIFCCNNFINNCYQRWKGFFSYNVLSDSYLICKEIKLISKPCLVHNLLMECLEKKKGHYVRLIIWNKVNINIIINSKWGHFFNEKKVWKHLFKPCSKQQYLRVFFSHFTME